MDLMQKADVNAAGPNDTNFNYQHASSEGVAPEKFVSFIATEYLKKPTVTAFLSLMNSFEPQVGTPERTGKQKKRKIGKFLDELLKTEVMNLLQEFLQRFKLFPTASHQNFKKFLEDLWFTEYARRGSVVDSSAFEHVFIGELEKGAVIGLHSWIRFAFLEETGAASYIGYKKEEHDSVAKIDFTWNNKRKKQSSMLLGSSPEFDMAAATICSLVYPGTLHARIPSHLFQARIIRMSAVEGRITGVTIALLLFTLILQVHTKKKASKRMTDEDVEKIIQQMENADVNAAGPHDVTFNYQLRHNEGDSPKRFFEFVNEEYLKKPIVVALLNLTQMYDPTLGMVENTSEDKMRMIERFLNLVMQTEVMNLLKQFLQRWKVLTTDSNREFKELLKELWFTPYSRSKSVLDTSAFEHYFVGETKGGKVSGLHNWIRLAFLEMNGDVDYKGFIENKKHSVATIHFTWNESSKPMSSFLLGTSPEFDMAASTVCSVFRPGIGKCRFFYKNCEVVFNSRLLAQNGKTIVYASFPAVGGGCRGEPERRRGRRKQKKS
uniref:Endoribonuclease n=1 Tax=Trichuris muris TaxID=70415 RepID=A0A5S6QPL3_TRIMR